MGNDITLQNTASAALCADGGQQRHNDFLQWGLSAGPGSLTKIGSGKLTLNYAGTRTLPAA